MLKASRKAVLRDPTPLSALVGKRQITPDDVTALHASEVGFGLRSRAEAETLFAIERSHANRCRAWGDFFVEMLADFVVWGERPSGTLTEDVALWLADQVGEVPSPAGLALLIAVVEDAQILPPWFSPAVRLRASKLFRHRDGVVGQQAA